MDQDNGSSWLLVICIVKGLTTSSVWHNQVPLKGLIFSTVIGGRAKNYIAYCVFTQQGATRWNQSSNQPRGVCAGRSTKKANMVSLLNLPIICMTHHHGYDPSHASTNIRCPFEKLQFLASFLGPDVSDKIITGNHFNQSFWRIFCKCLAGSQGH